MAIITSHKQIHCPNCRYEGKSKITGSSIGEGIVFLVLVVAALLIPIVWFAVVVLSLFLMIRPAGHICPDCGWKNVASLAAVKARGSSAQSPAGAPDDI